MKELANLLHSKHIGLTTVIAIADALAADARHNMWFFDCAKGKGDEKATLMALDSYDSVAVQCQAAIQRFDEDHNLPRLEEALRDFTRNIAALKT